jgi:hypothetical protein
MPASLTVKAKIETRFVLHDANNRPLGSFELVENWCGLSKLTCGSGKLSGEAIVVYTPDPGRPGDPLEIVKCTPKVREAIECFSPAG